MKEVTSVIPFLQKFNCFYSRILQLSNTTITLRHCTQIWQIYLHMKQCPEQDYNKVSVLGRWNPSSWSWFRIRPLWFIPMSNDFTVILKQLKNTDGYMVENMWVSLLKQNWMNPMSSLLLFATYAASFTAILALDAINTKKNGSTVRLHLGPKRFVCMLTHGVRRS